MAKKIIPVGVKAALITACATIVVALLGIIMSVTRKESSIDTHAQITATASGNNSTAQAAGHDINIGVSDSTLQQVVNLKEVELSERILTEYSHGCLILGLENGKVKYDSRLKDIEFDADWNNTTITVSNGNVDLLIPQLIVVSGGIHLNIGVAEQIFPLVEHKPVRTSWFNLRGLSLYCEVLDKDRRIFIIGCK
jgi:hypothetical protein